MTNSKPYKEGTNLETILDDGWSRGFAVSQTLREAKEMGYEVTESQVMIHWANLDIQYENSMKQ